MRSASLRYAAVLVVLMLAVSRAQPTTPPPAVIIVPAANLDPTARCEPFNSTVCNDIIPPGTPIYINSSAFPQSFLEVQASDIASQLGIVKSLYPDCAVVAALLNCLSFFQPCIDFPYTVNETISLPVDACITLCNDVNTKCAPLITQGLADPTDCTNYTPALYDLSALGGSSSVSLPCSLSLSSCINNATMVAANLSLPCTGETNNVVTCFRPEFMDPKTQCTTLKCPLSTAYWGHADAEAHYVVISVLGWICFVLAVLIVITSFMQPSQRQFPGYVMPLIGICIAVESFGFAMSSWFGRGRIDCDTSLRGVCRLQGIMIATALVAAVTWWLVLCFVTMIIGMANHPKSAFNKLQKYRWWFHTVWAMPFATLVMSAKWIRQPNPPGYDGSIIPICWFGNGNFLWDEDTAVVLPILVISTIGIIMWGIGCFHIVQSLRAGGTGGGLPASWHVRNVIYAAVVVIPSYIYPISHFAYIRPLYYDSHLEDYLSGLTPVWKASPPFSIVLVWSLCALATPVIYCVVIGTQRRNLDVWIAVFKKVRGVATVSNRDSGGTTSGRSAGPQHRSDSGSEEGANTSKF